MSRGIRHHLIDERGSALIEVLVTIPTALAVFAAVASISGVFGNSQSVTQDRSEAMADQQIATERMTREIRQARAAVNPGGVQTALQITTLANAAVRFVCAPDASGTTRTCRRQVPLSDGTWPVATAGTALVARVTNADVFTVGDDFVEIHLEVQSHDGGRTLSIADGVGLVNAP